ncbi:hypothetical protein [Ammonifex degensii]|nr:hypothetical protein [Ammonifex degensii]
MYSFLNQVAATSEEQSAAMEHIAQVARELAEMASSLEAEISRFRLS